jgi:hypothetical protein
MRLLTALRKRHKEFYELWYCNSDRGSKLTAFEAIQAYLKLVFANRPVIVWHSGNKEK